MYLPLWDSSWERRLHWSTRPPLEKIPRDSSPPWGKDLPRSSSPHLLHRIWDELYHVSYFPLIVHVPCGSCVFDCLVDVWFDLFLSVPLVFPLLFILFLGIPPPICERSPHRVPPYIILAYVCDGKHCMENKKNSTHMQDLSMEMHSNERGECVYVPS